ncbi:MAG: FAD:protein FMN transferase [Eggerthellaceae bacterium]|nr:FAD:protein FMN transferase [Eggerthellaceae bacterium]
MADYSNSYEIVYGESPESCTIRFRCFDTPNSVTVFGCASPDARVESLLVAIRNRCLHFHRCWSFSLAESDVSRINGSSVSVRVDDCTARLVRAMKDFHCEEPAFDFTVGTASYLWKHAKAVPDDGRVSEALSHVGAEKVRVEGTTVVKDDPLVQIDVGGAAKGFATDYIAEMLRMEGVRCASVDLGGNLYMLGSHPSGRPWRVSVRVPDGRDPVLEVVDRSVVTSGTYERSVEIDGVSYNHVIDARTGWPSSNGVLSATVVHESSLQADMLATVALIEDPDRLSARHPSASFTIIPA